MLSQFFGKTRFFIGFWGRIGVKTGCGGGLVIFANGKWFGVRGLMFGVSNMASVTTPNTKSLTPNKKRHV
jgi:hypothetical protein